MPCPILSPHRSAAGARRSGWSKFYYLVALGVCVFAPSGIAGGPGLRADEGIPSPRLAELKAATVFVKVEAGSWAGSGSGFIVRVEGGTAYVITNEHVIHPKIEQVVPSFRPQMPLRPGRPGVRVPLPGSPLRRVVTIQNPKLTLVFGSGTEREQAARAEIVAADPNLDLAVLKVSGIKDPPRPIDHRQTPPLEETRPVFVFGFPFGRALALNQGNPAMTIGKGTISSIRLNDRGEPAAVQIDGALNPGNSGGPVVDAEGRLVGVAVATIKGAGIGFAIPTAQVTSLLAGRVAAVRLLSRKVENGTATVEAQVQLLDPFGRIKTVAVHYLLSGRPDDKGPPAKQKTWSELPGSRRVDLKIEQQKASGTFQVPAGARTELGLTFQLSSVNASGLRKYTQPQYLSLHLRQPAENRSPPAAGGPGVPSSPVEMRAPALTAARVTKPLPAAVRDVAVGGGGRYLLLHLPALRKLAVFDVTQARVVHYLPLPADEVLFAAGRDKLLVGLPGEKLIERWSLTTFQRELVAPLPLAVPMTQLVMGSDSDGPLLVSGMLLDIHTLKPLDFQKPGEVIVGRGSVFRIRASADGRVYGLWVAAPVQNRYSYILGEKELRGDFGRDPGGPALPGPDGKVIYTSQGLFTPTWKPLGPSPPPGNYLRLPAVHGNYYLALDLERGNRKGPCIYVVGDDRPLVRLAEIEFGTEVISPRDEPLPPDKRLFFIPGAKLLITLPRTDDRLILYRVDVDEALEKSDTDYLFVTSPPPAAVRPGQTLDHALAVKSKRGGVRYRLQSGPPGMTVSPDGRLRWTVPSDWKEPEVPVTLSIGDRTGQEHSYTLSISVRS